MFLINAMLVVEDGKMQIKYIARKHTKKIPKIL